jgi:hypothetical protein
VSVISVHLGQKCLRYIKLIPKFTISQKKKLSYTKQHVTKILIAEISLQNFKLEYFIGALNTLQFKEE